MSPPISRRDSLSLCSDPVVVPVETEDKAEHSDPEKDEDVGITFIARKAETPKQRPKSGKTSLCHSKTQWTSDSLVCVNLDVISEEWSGRQRDTVSS